MTTQDILILGGLLIAVILACWYVHHMHGRKEAERQRLATDPHEQIKVALMQAQMHLLDHHEKAEFHQNMVFMLESRIERLKRTPAFYVAERTVPPTPPMPPDDFGPTNTGRPRNAANTTPERPPA